MPELTPELLFEASERLDQRCEHHFALQSSPRATYAHDDYFVVATGGDFIAYDWSGAELWHVEAGFTPFLAFFAHDDFVAVSAGRADVISAGGEHKNSFALTGHAWGGCRVQGRRQFFCVVHDSFGVRYDVDSGDLVEKWDMLEDYSFGRDGVQIDGIAAAGDRSFVISGREITQWVDGCLERLGYVEGDHYDRWAAVNWLATPDGRHLVEGSSNFARGLVAYDAETLDFIGQSEGEVEELTFAAQRPAGWVRSCLISANIGNGVTTSSRAADLVGHHAISLRPDGQKMLSVSMREEICIWDVGAWPELEFPIEAPPQIGGFTRLARSPDGSKIAATRQDSEMKLVVVDLADGAMTELSHDADVAYPTELHWLDDRRVFSAQPTNAFIWDVDGGAAETVLDRPTIGADAEWILVHSSDGIERLDPVTLQPVRQYDYPEDWYEPSGTDFPHLVIGRDSAYDGAVFDLEKQATVFDVGGEASGRFLVTEEWDDDYRRLHRVIDMTSFETVHAIGSEASITDVFPSPNGRTFVRTHEGIVGEWVDGEMGGVLYRPGDTWLTTLQLSDDGAYLVGATNAEVYVWDTEAPGEPVARFEPSYAPTGQMGVFGHILFTSNTLGYWSIYRLG